MLRSIIKGSALRPLFRARLLFLTNTLIGDVRFLMYVFLFCDHVLHLQYNAFCI